ncbi:MAG: DMT family transporter, partial [Prevotella sp.]|nr:DMT family transporter [Prevotella sp.]
FIFDKLKKDKVELTPAEKKKARRDLLIGGFCCGTALAVASNFQQAGIAAGTEAGKAGFLTALYVVLVPLFGLFFRRKVSLPVWIAVVLSVASLYLLCIKGEFTLAMGDLLVLVCAVCFAIHILVIDHFTAKVDGIKLSCVQFFVAAVWATLAKLVCAILGANGIGDTSVVTSIFAMPDWAGIWACILPILYVGVFSSGVAYTLQILAQKDSNPTVVTILLSLESVFAVIAGAIILQQQMTGREYLGCVLMLVAVILAQIPNPFEKKVKA